jgi:DNA-binding GntR family transcriptional regulator
MAANPGTTGAAVDSAAAANAPSRGAEAYAEIKRRILFNEYPGGFQILEEALCDELGMSRTPLREALVRLQNEGMVEILPRRGVRVLPLTARDIADIYQVLSALELLAARSLAEMADNDRQVARLQAEVDAMQRALQNDDLTAWAVFDERFHRILVDESGNPRLANAARTLLDQSQRFRMFTLRLRDKPTGSTKSHAELVRHLRRHDVVGAVTAHAGHKQRWHDSMRDLMQRFGIRQI